MKDLADIEIVTAFPIPVGNSAGTRLLQKCGVAGAECAAGLDEEAFAALQKHAAIPVCRSAAAVPVLATRLRLVPGEWAGTRGKVRVEYDRREGLSKIFTLSED